jgi:hypothetical protein
MEQSDGTAWIRSLSERLEKLTEHGDRLEVLDATEDFELSRA